MLQSIELYATLTKGEKNYIFRKLSKLGKSQLLLLYKGLSQPKRAVDLGNKKSKTDLAILYNQLRYMMLESLCSYQQNGSIEVEFRNSMNQIEILKNKFLYRQALKKIGNLQKKLRSHERYSFLQEVSLSEIEINYFLLSEKEFHNSIEEIQADYNQYKRKNENFHHQKLQFYQELGKIHNYNLVSHSKERDEVFNDSENRSAKYYFLRTSLIRSLNKNQRELAQDISIELLDILRINSHEFVKLPFQLLEINFMCALAFLSTGNVQRYRACLEEMRVVRQMHSFLELKYEERYHYLYWIKAALVGDTEGNHEEVVRDIQTTLKPMSIEFKYRIIEQIANYFIEQQNFKDASRWNRILTNLTRQTQIQEFKNRAELRAIYIRLSMDKLDMADTLISRILSSKYKPNFHFHDALDILDEIQRAPEKKAALLLPMINFWKYAT